jgi:SNF2 family DNA or RNA helicase
MSDDEFGAKQQTVLVRLLRLSQIASNPRLVDPTFSGVPAKVREIDDLLAQLIGGNGRKVVLWSYYVQTIQELLERYRRYSPVAVYGGVELALRGEAVRRFQEDDEVKLLIGNPQAAGSGLTLTAAPYAIYETVNWRYDLYAQSLDRIHRIGQDRNVTYFEILAADSIDVHMRERLHEKGQFAAELLGDTATTPSLERSEVLRMLRP